MSTQTGTYFLGTFGFPILIKLGEDLTGATAVTLDLTKPDGTTVHLTTPTVTNAAAGEVTYAPAAADVNLPGVYTFLLTVALGSSRSLTSEGQFTISQSLSAAVTLVLEDGTGLANSNSYVSIAEANVFLRNRLYSDEWFNASALKQKQALIMGASTIDSNFYFLGWKTSPAQAMEWPRTGVPNRNVYNDYPLFGRLYYWGINNFPQDVVIPPIKYANALMALELLRGDRTIESDSKGIRSLGLGQGAIDITFDETTAKVPLSDEVQRILAPYGSTRYGGGVGRAVPTG